MLRSAVIFICLLLARQSFAAEIHGQQPNISIDAKGTVRMVYGEGEKIYCSTSSDNGQTFSDPVLVAQVEGMHLGHTRGPQIASSKDYTLITAIDKSGSINTFVLNHLKNKWIKLANANDVKGSAVEGLMALTADKDDNFYAAWLDIRMEKKNNIFFSSFDARAGSWAKNVMVYHSPDQHVCECCRPTVSYNNNKVVVGFRNWLMGSRDIYYAISVNKGKTFTSPKKSGTGTWQLNACPMDGGGLSVDGSGKVSTAWRRNGDVFYWSESQPEQKIGTGRDVSMAQAGGETIIAWQENNMVKVMDIGNRRTVELGKGASPRVYLSPTGKILCVWEDDNTIRYKSL